MKVAGRWMAALKQRHDCRRKRKFANRGAAEAAAKTGEWMRMDPVVELRAYKCTWCTGWHLTSGGVRP